MNSLLERTLGKLSVWQTKQLQQRAYERWERAGRPNPPPHLVKQRVLRHYAQQYGLEILVETGTYRGDMIHAMRYDFKQLYSIELSPELYAAAGKRFRSNKQIQILQGDSGVVLERLIPKLDKATLFWLDGHYSAGATARGAKDTPIFEELDHVFSSSLPHYVVIVDDARLFGADPAYPSVKELKAFVESRIAGATIEIDTDSIRIIPEKVARAVA